MVVMADNAKSHGGGRDEVEFRGLVARTSGVQPWRRVLHALTGCLIAAAVVVSGVPPSAVAGALGGVLVLLVVLDSVRLRSPRLNAAFFRLFRSLASPREAERAVSGSWYVAGAALALALFPRQAAVAGILVLALADPAAHTFGRRYGKIRLGKGTLEGSLAFFCVALGVALLTVPVPAALAAAVAATLVEPLPLALDDNLTIPLAGAAAVVLAQAV